MGSGASIEDREVLKKSIYSAAAAVYPDEDLEEEEDGFPKKVLLQFVAEKVCREEVVAELSLWAKGQREKELEDKHLWQEVMEEIKHVEPLEPLFSLLFEVIGGEPEVVLQSSWRHESLCKHVLKSLGLETLSDGRMILDSFFPGYHDMLYEEHWRMDFYMSELLPRGKAAIEKLLLEKNEEGKCTALQEQLENGLLHVAAEMLRLGADPQGLLDPPEVDELLSLYHELNAHAAGWSLDKQLRVALARGDLSAFQSLLAKADVNQDRCDGDAKCYSLLALALSQRWDFSVARHLLPVPSGHEVRLERSLEAVQMLLAQPGLDPNRGAYSYGWHGSYVRATPVALLLMKELDTGACHVGPEADGRLVAPRRQLLELLVRDPRVDLEYVFHERGEETEGRKLGALAFLDQQCDYNCPMDLMAGKILMQAGAKMTPSWLRLLEELHQGGGEQEMWRERLERALEEEKKEHDVQKLVREGVTYVPQDYPLDVKLSDAVRLRMAELQEVQEWYAVVRRGSQVFADPKAFPPDFCRAARALDRALKGRIGRGGVGRVLDFLHFFEFNRRRVKTSYHEMANLFGRPLPPVLCRAERLERRIQKRMEGEEPEEPAAEPAEEPETCWVPEEPEPGEYDDPYGGDYGE